MTRRVIEMDMDGNRTAEYSSIRNCQQITGHSYHKIESACLGNIPNAYGSKWRFAKTEPKPKSERVVFGYRTRKGCNPVDKLDSSGNYICTYRSMTDAAEAVGCDTTSIGKVLEGKRLEAAGFRWRYCPKASEDEANCIRVKGSDVEGWAVETLRKYHNVNMAGREIELLIKKYGADTLATYMGIKIGRKVQIRPCRNPQLGYVAEVIG